MSAEDTVFHKIIRKEIPAEVVYEDEQVIAFRDINPVASTHVLVVPKKTVPMLDAVTPADVGLLGHMMVVASQIARSEGISESGYRVVINNGVGAGQSVFQLHFHVIGGRRMGWPPG